MGVDIYYIDESQYLTTHRITEFINHTFMPWFEIKHVRSYIWDIPNQIYNGHFFVYSTEWIFSGTN